MSFEISIRSGMAAMGAIIATFAATNAEALTPTVVWQAAGIIGGTFSADGTSVYATTSTGFQLRRASDGAVLSSITLPAASQAYDTAAFSPDKQYVAVSIRADGVSRIELWRFSSGALTRTITTDATRNIKGVDLSPNSSLLGTVERFAYGGGGYVRVFRTSDGAQVLKTGPVIVNSSTFARFSPGGTYMAYRHSGGFFGLVVLRTSDWGQASQIGDDARLVQWVPPDGSASIWRDGDFDLGIPFQQVSVPSGAVVRSVLIDDNKRIVGAVTPNNKYFLAGQLVSTDPGAPIGDSLYFLRTTDGGAQVTYQFNSTIVSAAKISSTGTYFTYNICPTNGSSCTLYLAQMPSLP